MIDEVLRFGWWNTSLSKNVATPAKSAKREKIAASVLRTLLVDERVALLALGEMSAEVVDRVFTDAALPGQFRAWTEAPSPGQLPSNLALIYNSAAVAVRDHTLLRVQNRRQELRVATLFELDVATSEARLDFYVAHWPSRMIEAASESRRAAGSELARTLENRASQGKAAAVVVGDFNDEPFDESIRERMQSTRDRECARARRALLYNPCWRLLGHHQPHHPKVSPRDPAGTYFYTSKPETRWHSFDQVLVAPTFVDPTSNVQLDEREVRVVIPTVLLARRGDGDSLGMGFDHLPILGAIARCDTIGPPKDSTP